MNKAAALAAVLAILVLGVLVGILGTHLYYAQKFRRPGSMATVASQFFAERLDRELSLTADQRQAIGAILDETRSEADALRSELRPRIGALMEEASERIAEVLTPRQRERFAELRARHRGRAEHFFLGPPGHPGPPGAFGHRGHWRRPWRERPMPPPPEPVESPAESPRENADP